MAVRKTFTVVAASLLILLVQAPVMAEDANLGSCAGVDKVETELTNGSSSGYYIPGLKLIILNKAVLKDYAAPVQRFIFAHECAHADPAIGQDEAAADCAAVRQGVREGWLGKPDIIKVCAHLARFPADATHAPLPVRCAQLRQCSGLYDAPSKPVQQEAAVVEPALPRNATDLNVTPLTRLARNTD